jgi:TonB-dependent SusC/RagA subfamily outer membrane receptor
MTRWKLRAFSAMTLIATAAAAAVAQQPAGAVGTVTGQVVAAESKAPLQGALVSVTGTALRATATAEGRYVLRNVPPGSQTIRVQLLGFSPKEQTVTVTAAERRRPTSSSKDIPYAVAPVVTTALGIAREEKSLGYATTSISSATLEKIPEMGIMQALAGQSAGVAMTSGSGRPGAGARVVIRGETSFSGTGQPLFVIDGVPVSTASDSRSDPLGTGTSGSRQMDIDMENAEEVSILKGAAATALYGSRAANGAVIIKTKSGKTGQPLRFNFSTEYRYDTPILADTSPTGRPAIAGTTATARTSTGWMVRAWVAERDESAADAELGTAQDSIPKIVLDSMGAVRFRDPRADFYVSAPTSNNALRGTGGMGDLGAYTLGITYLNQSGVNPQEKLGRLNLNANVNINLTKWLSTTANVQRIRSNNPYQDDSFSGIDKTLIDMPSTFDVRRGYLPDGTPVFLTSAQIRSRRYSGRPRTSTNGAHQSLDRIAAVVDSRRPGHPSEQQRRSRHVCVGVWTIPESAAVVGRRRNDVGLDTAAKDDENNNQRRPHPRRGRASSVREQHPSQWIAWRQHLLAGQRRAHWERHVDRDSQLLQHWQFRDANGYRNAHDAAPPARRLQSSRDGLFRLGLPDVHRPQRLELDAADERELVFLSVGPARGHLHGSDALEAELARLRQDPSVEGEGGQRRSLVCAHDALQQCERGRRRQRPAAEWWTRGHVPVPRHHVVHQ